MEFSSNIARILDKAHRIVSTLAEEDNDNDDDIHSIEDFNDREDSRLLAFEDNDNESEGGIMDEPEKVLSACDQLRTPLSSKSTHTKRRMEPVAMKRTVTSYSTACTTIDANTASSTGSTNKKRKQSVEGVREDSDETLTESNLKGDQDDDADCVVGGNGDAHEECSPKKKRRTWKKPADKPKRPLSAYNLFFQLERDRIINEKEECEFTTADINALNIFQNKQKKRRHRKTHGKISFAELARTIAEKWKNLDQNKKDMFSERAEAEKNRYKDELSQWSSVHGRKCKSEDGAWNIAGGMEANMPETGAVSGSVFSTVLVSPEKTIPKQMMGIGSERPTPRRVSQPFASDGSRMMSMPQGPRGNSLNALLSHGNRYIRQVSSQNDFMGMDCYQPSMEGGVVVEDCDEDCDLQQTRMEHMRAMMAYNRQLGRAGMSGQPMVMVPAHQSGMVMMSPHDGSQTMMMGPGGACMPMYCAPQDDCDYYEMADQAYNMAQLALPMAHMARTGFMMMPPQAAHVCTPMQASSAVMQQHLQEHQRMLIMQQQQQQQQQQHIMAVQQQRFMHNSAESMMQQHFVPAGYDGCNPMMMMMGMSGCNVDPQGAYFDGEEQGLYADGVVDGYPIYVGANRSEEVALDPHQGLSSPFDPAMPQQDAYDDLMDAFENA